MPIAKFWNMASVSEEEGEIILYGDVVDAQPVDWWTGEALPGNFITPEGFLEDLETVKGKAKITVKLNSCGGDLFTGIAIHNAIKALNADTTVIVEGIAASAASVIMCAGKKVKCYPGSIVMIHGASTRVYGNMNQQDFEKYARALEGSNRAIAAIYAAKTGKETEDLLNMMADESWMTGAEAVERGFADEIVEETQNASITCSADRKTLFLNGVPHEMGHRIPDFIKVSNQAKPVDIHAKKANKEKGESEMNLEQLKKEHPELVAQIQAELDSQTQAKIDDAVKQERERLAEIDEISATIPEQQMVQEAKYGETRCSAQELSFRALKESAKSGQRFLADFKEDGKESGTGEVLGNPSAGVGKTKEEKEREEVKAVVDAYYAGKGVK